MSRIAAGLSSTSENRDVTPIPKGSHGKPTRCPDTNELKRACKCRRCVGARNKRKGREKQRAAANALHIPASKFASQMGHEENLRGAVRIEVKSGQFVKAMTTRYLAAEAQSEACRPVGDNRPFVFVAMPDGMSDGLAVVRLSKLDAMVDALSQDEGNRA